MEDALALSTTANVVENFDCLNPCCNGRCTRTTFGRVCRTQSMCLNPCCNGRCTRTPPK